LKRLAHQDVSHLWVRLIEDVSGSARFLLDALSGQLPLVGRGWTMCGRFRGMEALGHRRPVVARQVDRRRPSEMGADAEPVAHRRRATLARPLNALA
jgi:hypothetical protein